MLKSQPNFGVGGTYGDIFMVHVQKYHIIITTVGQGKKKYGLYMCLTLRSLVQGWSLVCWLKPSILNPDPRWWFCKA